MNNYSNPVTVTGNPASFEASGDGKLLSLSVPFSPIQDLHGYDHPWPAGGGKNAMPSGEAGTKESNGIIATSDGHGNYTISGTSSYAADISFDLETGFTIPTSDTHSLFFMNDIGVSGVTFYFRNGSTNVDSFGLSTANRVSPSYVTIGGKVCNRVRFYISANTEIPGTMHLSPMIVTKDVTGDSFIPYSNLCPISGRTGLSVYVSPTQDQQDATTYAVDWTSEAGTVYGGTLDVVTGVLTVDWVSVDMGTLNYTYDSAGRFYTSINGKKNEASDQDMMLAISSMYMPMTATAFQNTPTDGTMRGATTGGYVYFRNSAYTDAATFKTAMSGVQLCYELATPLTYQLTATQIALILGQNNVWSDSNEAVTLTYVIELFTRYTFIVNGNDYTGLVERDSYRTAVTPVYGETIQTLDGVGHTALLRVKGSLTVKLNPQTAAQTAAICADLLNAPCEVQYKCLQRNVNVTALMVLDVVSAMFLSRCLYLGQKWNDVDEIVLKEL
jgi:hypothetical protein